MSSQSSAHSNELIDEICSNDSYSSGWERSSTSEYWGSSDTEDFVDDENYCSREDFYAPPKRTGKPTLFDVEYKCELVVLPNPYKQNKNNTKKQEEMIQIAESSSVEQTIEAINPWKKEETPSGASVDPWKFLDDMKKPAEKHTREPRREREREERRKISRPIDNSNTNKLCKYKGDCRMNKNNNCNMIHSLAEWKPRVCRFNNNCKRKAGCGYYHTDTPIAEYLKIMMKTRDTIYAQNSALYTQYL
jgi:hypothetical protein